jgi:hypothetical protein
MTVIHSQPPRWREDHENPDSVDDLFAVGAIHLEQMSACHYWLGITIGDRTYHINLHSKRRITAYAADLPPSKDALGRAQLAADSETGER